MKNRFPFRFFVGFVVHLLGMSSVDAQVMLLNTPYGGPGFLMMPRTEIGGAHHQGICFSVGETSYDITSFAAGIGNETSLSHYHGARLTVYLKLWELGPDGLPGGLPIFSEVFERDYFVGGAGSRGNIDLTPVVPWRLVANTDYALTLGNADSVLGWYGINAPPLLVEGGGVQLLGGAHSSDNGMTWSPTIVEGDLIALSFQLAGVAVPEAGELPWYAASALACWIALRGAVKARRIRVAVGSRGIGVARQQPG